MARAESLSPASTRRWVTGPTTAGCSRGEDAVGDGAPRWANRAPPGTHCVDPPSTNWSLPVLEPVASVENGNWMAAADRPCRLLGALLDVRAAVRRMAASPRGTLRGSTISNRSCWPSPWSPRRSGRFDLAGAELAFAATIATAVHRDLIRRRSFAQARAATHVAKFGLWIQSILTKCSQGAHRSRRSGATAPPDHDCSPTLRSCSAHEYGRALARPVTVRSAGAVPSRMPQ
jgi:hypothetical protein